MNIKVAIVGGGYGLDVYGECCRQSDVFLHKWYADSGTGRHLGKLSEGVQYIDTRSVCNTDADIVCVAVPQEKQYQVVKELLYGRKRVICEKPFSSSAIEAQELVNIASRLGLKGNIGYQYRYEPGIFELRKQIGSGMFGRVVQLEMCWVALERENKKTSKESRDDESYELLMSHGSHMIDLTRTILGKSALKIVEARWGIQESRSRSALERSGFEARVRGSNREEIGIRCSRGPKEEAGLEVRVSCEMGELCYKHTYPFTWREQVVQVTDSGSKPRVIGVDQWFRDVDDTRIAALERMLLNCCGLVNDMVCAPATFEDAAQTWRLLEEIRYNAG